MKIFVIGKKTGGIFLLAAAIFTFLLFRGSGRAVPVTAEGTTPIPIYAVDRGEKKVAVTFNAAWGAEDTESILKTLDAFGAKCTFFLLGTWAEKYPETAAKIKEAGHEIGGHGYDHRSYAQMTATEIEKDLAKTETAIQNATGEGIRLFRAPSGDYSEKAVNTVRILGKEIIQWDVDSLDYENLSAEEMKARILPRIRPGSIILFHTGTKNTAPALPGLLEAIREAGYEFETVGDLLLQPPFKIDHRGVQYKAQEG